MKKNIITMFSLMMISALLLGGCRKEETEPVIVPDTIVEEQAAVEDSVEEPVVEVPVVEEPIVEEPIVEEPIVEEPIEEEPLYDPWWDLHDYNLDQEVLVDGGEFKNLTIQPGNEPDQLNITWFSKSSSRGKVNFTADGLFHNISAKAKTEPSVSVPGYYRNSATIDGLESNTVYTYTLKNGGSESPVYTYETKDLYSTDFTFTIAGDPEIGLGDEDVLPGHRSVWRVVLNRMKTDIPDSSFIITTGDQVANPSSTVHYDYFLDNSVLYSTPLVPMVGNHDNGTGFFGDHFSLPNMSPIAVTDGRDGDYWFTRGNALFMVLNSMNPSPMEVHEPFIEEAIAANPDAKWRIVLSHYSPITMVERYQGIRESIKVGYYSIDAKFDIDLFIGGHDHIYTRGYSLDDDGDPIFGDTGPDYDNPKQAIYMVANGATDALLRDPDDNYPWSIISSANGVPQLSQVHVTENSITVETHDADKWNTVDKFTIYKD